MGLREKIINDFKGNGEMIEIPCSSNYSPDQPVCVCRETGLVRVKEIRPAEEIVRAWSDQVYSSNFGSDTYTARIPAVKARQTYVADFADVHIGLKGKFICDIGTGEGQFLEIVTGPGYQAKVYGIEPSPKNCNQLENKGFEFFNGSIEDYLQTSLFHSQRFDVVTLMWTLVNSHSCLDMVAAAWRMLKPGGYIVVGEGSRILVPFKKPLHYYFSKLPADLHPYHLSANSLQNLLKINGFEITAINRYIDSDYLCVIGKKTNEVIQSDFKVDNYTDVLAFFDRWHSDTQTFFSKL